MDWCWEERSQIGREQSQCLAATHCPVVCQLKGTRSIGIVADRGRVKGIHRMIAYAGSTSADY